MHQRTLLLCACVSTMPIFLTTQTGMSALGPARLSGWGTVVGCACVCGGFRLCMHAKATTPPAFFQSLTAKRTGQPQTSEGRLPRSASVFALNDGGKGKKKEKKALGGGVCTPPHAPVCGPGLVLPSDSW